MTRTLRAHLIMYHLIETIIMSVVYILLPITRPACTTTSKNLSIMILTRILQVKRRDLRRLRQRSLRRCYLSIIYPPYLMSSLISTARTRILSTIWMYRVLLSRNRPRSYSLRHKVILRRQLRLLIIRRVQLPKASVKMTSELISK